MTLMVALRCERYTPFGLSQQSSPCDLAEIMWTPTGNVTMADIAEQITKAGWVTVDGKHYCRRHNPADVGTLWEIQFDQDAYHEIPGTGFEIRYIDDRKFELRRVRSEA